MSKIIVEPEMTQMAIWRHFACWISKATREQAHIHIHTRKYVRFIAFSGQKMFRERARMSRYTHIACLVTAVLTLD
jgi:hypothetical protein